MDLQEHTDRAMDKLGLRHVRICYAIQRMNMVTEWQYIAGPRLTWTPLLQGAWTFKSTEEAAAILPRIKQMDVMSATARVVEVYDTECGEKHEWSWSRIGFPPEQCSWKKAFDTARIALAEKEGRA